MKLPPPKKAELLPHHVKHLAESGITTDVAIDNGIYSETNAVKIAVALGWKNASKLGPCLMFPVRRLDGSVAYTRLRPDRPRLRKDKPVKYESPKGVQQQPYFPHGIDDVVDDVNAEIIFTEGEKKSVCATAYGFPCIGLSGVHGWKKKDHHALGPVLSQINWAGRQVRIAFDSDVVDNPQLQSAESQLAETLANQGAIVRIVRTPSAEDGSKQGVDDFIVANGIKAFRELIEQASEPEGIEGSIAKDQLGSINPEDVAQEYVQSQYQDNALTLRYWQGSFQKYYRGRYEELPDSDVRADLVRVLSRDYCAIKQSDVSNVMLNVQSRCSVLSLRRPPVWLDGGDHIAKAWDAGDTFVTRSHLINLRLLCDRKPDAVVVNSPHYFNFSAADYEFDHQAPAPIRWLNFLNELWPDDPSSIELLRQWIGYLLTLDTRQQKIMLMVGPKRSGKGTIARVIRAVIGDRNCCAPTLAGLATNFGLSPLLGKSAAIIGDARLSRRTDVAATTERLLSISGEDGQTIDRKHKEPVTVQLPTRFTIISNELPSLDDASGALAGRLLILRLTQSFYGGEDKNLSHDLLAERQGILLWAIGGWYALRQAGRFTQPESGQDLVDQMQDLASPTAEFVRERCRLGPDASVRLADLYREFREWEELRGTKHVVAVNTFSRDLTAAFPSLRRARSRAGTHADSLPTGRKQDKSTWFTGIAIE